MSIRVIQLALTLLLFKINAAAQVSDFSTINFSRADSVAQQYHGHSLSDVRGLALKLTGDLPTEVEKFRAIYRWICENIEYDYALNLENQKQRRKLSSSGDTSAYNTWNRAFTSRVSRVLLKNKRTVCTGYASLLKTLSLTAGLNCIVIDGYGRTGESNIRGPGLVNHSWNAVELNKKWYLCDPTWSSGAYDNQDKSYIKKFEACYFLAGSDVFIRNHYPIHGPSLIGATDLPELTTFLNRPVFYVNSLRRGITKCKPDQLDVSIKKGMKQTFEIEVPRDSITSIAVLINGTLYHKEIKDSISKGFILIDHTFTSKGKRSVHILINNEHAITYDVSVN